MAIATINPATGDVVRRFNALSATQLDARLKRASTAATQWRLRSVAERAAVVGRMGDLLIERRDEYARIMTLEMGKLIGAARDEATKCADACHYFAEHAPEFLARDEVAMKGERAWVEFHPIGVVLAVM